MRVTAIVLCVLLAALAVPRDLRAGVAAGIVGLVLPVDLEASTVQTRQIASNEWVRIAQWVPIIGFFAGFSRIQTVYEHRRAVSGRFLGGEATGILRVLEVRSHPANPMMGGGAGASWEPVDLVISTKYGRLAVVFAGRSERGYQVTLSAQQQSDGIFGGVEVAGWLRVVGLQGPDSFVRGELVVGHPGVEEAVQAAERAGLDAASLREALSTAKLSVMPFPPVSGRPPERTEARWLVRPSGSEGVTVDLVIRAGRDVLEPGAAADARVRLRVVAAQASGSPLNEEVELAPGEQARLSLQLSPPAVVMVMRGARTLVQFRVGTVETPDIQK